MHQLFEAHTETYLFILKYTKKDKLSGIDYDYLRKLLHSKNVPSKIWLSISIQHVIHFKLKNSYFKQYNAF